MPKHINCFVGDVFQDIAYYWRRWPLLSLGEHIHNDHVAGLVIHHEVEHVSSNLFGFEVHGVITLAELIGLVLRTGCVGLGHHIEASRSFNRYVGYQLQPGSNRAYNILCPVRCSLDPKIVGLGWYYG